MSEVTKEVKKLRGPITKFPKGQILDSKKDTSSTTEPKKKMVIMTGVAKKQPDPALPNAKFGFYVKHRCQKLSQLYQQMHSGREAVGRP